MTQLSDTQMLLLSKAAQRDDHAIQLPETLKGGAAGKVVASLIKHGYANEMPAQPGMPEWRRDEQTGAIALIATEAGLDAIGIETGTDARAEFDVERDTPWGEEGCIRDDPDTASQGTVSAEQTIKAPRPGSKQAQAIALLQRPEGATIDDLIQATGWLPHTTRAALTGLRKRGYAIQKHRADGQPTVYRVEASADPAETVSEAEGPGAEQVGSE